MIKHSDVLIIGGGISGLSTAWWLSQKGIKSTLLEKANQPGGLIDTTIQQGYTTDHAASMILNFNSDVTRFISSTDMDRHKKLRNKISTRYIIKNNTLCPVPTTLFGLLFSNFLSGNARLQLMTEAFRPRTKSDSESVANFVRRRLGQEILDLAIDPYVSAVLANDPEQACARSTLPRLTSLEDQFGSITAGIIAKKLIPGRKGLPHEAFAFTDGMKSFVNNLKNNSFADIRVEHEVIAIEPYNEGWRIVSKSNSGEQQFICRQLVFSTPANITAKLLSSTHFELSNLLNKIHYSPIAQVHLGFDRTAFKKPMNGNGFLLPSSSKMPIRGSLWMSNLINNRAPEGKILTSNYLGGASHSKILSQPDDKLTDTTVSTLEKLTQLKQSPEMVRVNKFSQGLPLYHGNYYQLTNDISHYCSKMKGLHLVANYMHGISVRDRIIQAINTTRIITQQLDRASSPISYHSIHSKQSECLTQ